MNHHRTTALRLLDTDVARLAHSRTWARAQASWPPELRMRFARAVDVLDDLRGSGAETDSLARSLVVLAAAGDGPALTLVLASLAGVFVAVARRRPGDVGDAVADQLSLAVEIVCTTGLPDEHVLSVLASRVQSRYRRMRRRTEVTATGAERFDRLASSDDPARQAVIRVELGELRRAVHRHVVDGSFTTDDWRRLVELRVHQRRSSDLARVESMSAAAVRKRAQRTAAVLVAELGMTRGAA